MKPVPTFTTIEHCVALRKLHSLDTMLLLPNVWDAASARAVVAAGFPAVATSSGAVAAAVGYADHEAAPADEMFAAAARIARAVPVPVTVDAEAGYRMEPDQLIARLLAAGAAGCNLEDTDHRDESLRDPKTHADWLRAVHVAASDVGYPLLINARVDVFLGPFFAGAPPGSQIELVPDAVERAHLYLEAGAECVYPIGLWEQEALEAFVSQVSSPVNVICLPQSPSLQALAAAGVARVSWATLLHRDVMAHFEQLLATIATTAGTSDSP
jgi:2-methylisocitrate lyase-like PEP mutase family enzyme